MRQSGVRRGITAVTLRWPYYRKMTTPPRQRRLLADPPAASGAKQTPMLANSRRHAISTLQGSFFGAPMLAGSTLAGLALGTRRTDAGSCYGESRVRIGGSTSSLRESALILEHSSTRLPGLVGRPGGWPSIRASRRLPRHSAALAGGQRQLGGNHAAGLCESAQAGFAAQHPA